MRILGHVFGCGWLLIGLVRGGEADPNPSAAPRGFIYQHDVVAEKPWSIHIIKVDRSAPDLELQTTLGGGRSFGLATLSEQLRTIPPEAGQPVAAINGDFFRYEYPYVGEPQGLQILRGEMVSGPFDWTCFWIDAARVPRMTNVQAHFAVTWPGGETTPVGLNEPRETDAAVLYTSAVGRSTHTTGGSELILERNGTNTWLPIQPGGKYPAKVREVRDAGDTPLEPGMMILSLGKQAMTQVPRVAAGAVLRISLATTPDLTGAKVAIGGGPPIVRAGKIVEGNGGFMRHPRAALGWNATHLFLVEVDGRQRSLSIGMTYSELAEYMLKLGCDTAMCLDGGGSATCWIQGRVVNSPSERRERPMANALVVVKVAKPASSGVAGHP